MNNEVFDEVKSYLNENNKDLGMRFTTALTKLEACLQIVEASKNVDKPLVTEKGATILKYLQEHPEPAKARDIADQMGMVARTLSGSLRKLVTDGFVDKIGKDPCIYVITDKGKEFKIN